MNGFEYTSVQLSVSEGMIPHCDVSNIGPSWTIAMGDFQGGLLWVESKEGRTNTFSIYSTKTGTKCERK
eukprot:2311435-Prorocentrum_lima.AAC.1